MPYRLFEDSRSVEWQVWDVVPRLVERRSGYTDRRAEATVIEFANRRSDDRRIANLRRARLRGNYAQGWLAFDNGREKRRLTPIPGDWITCPEQKLETYSRQAHVVPGSHRGTSPHHGDEDRMAEAG